MKQISFAIFLLTMVVSLPSSHLQAQDYFKTDMNMIQVLADTSFGRASIVTFTPGYKTKVHDHPAHFVYALTSGSIRVQYVGGESFEFHLKEGEGMIFPPEQPHWTENIGKSDIRFILVEFKEHPYKPMKMKK